MLEMESVVSLSHIGRRPQTMPVIVLMVHTHEHTCVSGNSDTRLRLTNISHIVDTTTNNNNKKKQTTNK